MVGEHRTPLGRDGRLIQSNLVAAGNCERTGARRKWSGVRGGILDPQISTPRLVSANSAEWKSPGQLSSIVPPFIQRQHGTARSPLYTTEVEAPSSAKRSQERGQPRRSNVGRPGDFTSLATEPRNRILDLADICSFDLKKPGTQRYVYKCI